MTNSISSNSIDSDDDSTTAAVRDQYDTSPEDETIVVEPTSELESPENEKRGPGRPPKPKEVPPPPHNVSISYTLIMFSYSEMKKPKARRSGEPAIIKLSNDKPFDTLKAQILKCISEALKPKKLAYDDYKVTFTVARHQTSPLSLKKQSEFDHLLECVLKMKAPAAKILVEASKKPDPPTPKKKRRHDGGEQTSEDSDMSQGSNSDSDRKKKKKKKKDPSELPLNVELSAQMKLLQNRYTCNKPGCLSSGYCYILPDNNAHFTLSHRHLSVWAAALAAKPPITTIEKPPNHKEFDGLSSNLLSDTAPLIQCRLAERNNAQAAPSASNTPTINFNVPNDFFSFLRPATGPNPLLYAAPADHVSNTIDAPLLSVSARPGPDLPLADFCAAFELSQDIHAKLADNGYTGTRTIRYIIVSELKEMGFKNGEIAAMKDAVARWATRD
ncbi:hypothetical protein EDD22DRAFT_853643 [Suillus occidentalis]|nr:hypothetical protein EDD22DRAFT_853643 [Suillus occidentalis]